MSPKKKPEGPHDLLPMNPVDFQVLVVLLEGENHGYGIVKALRKRSEGQIDMLPGNFYTVLQRMLRDGLVVDAGEDVDANAPGRPRRLYGITAFGRAVAAAEAARLRDLVADGAVQALAEEARNG